MKLIFENIPVIAFFICYKFFNYDIQQATFITIILSILMIIISAVNKQKPSYISCISISLLIVMGILSIVFDDIRFIKMKSTIINTVFATILLVGIYNKTGLMKYIFVGNIEMTEANWLVFSRRFMLYFIGLAVINELVWRNCSESFWVSFKLFGMLLINILFLISQAPFLARHKI